MKRWINFFVQFYDCILLKKGSLVLKIWHDILYTETQTNKQSYHEHTEVCEMVTGTCDITLIMCPNGVASICTKI